MTNIVHVGCNDSTVMMVMVEIRATLLYDQLRRQCNGLWSGHMNNKDISDFVGGECDNDVEVMREMLVIT